MIWERHTVGSRASKREKVGKSEIDRERNRESEEGRELEM